MVIGYKILMPVLLAAKFVFSIIDGRRNREKIMVNIGGGVFIKRHWLNLDYKSPGYPYPSAVLDYDFDLTSSAPLPFGDNSVMFFYSSHTLEHILQEYCPAIFSEIYRCLKPGGAVRLTMPNYDQIYEGYKERRSGFWAKSGTPEDSLLGGIATNLRNALPAHEIRAAFESMTKEDFGNHITGLVRKETQFANFSNHCNWWNFEKLRQSLECAGFRNIYRSAPGGSRFPEMRDRGSFLGIERLCRMPSIRGFDVAHPDKSVFVEAVK
jgi:predicted SAM-dependent methyltransferase